MDDVLPVHEPIASEARQRFADDDTGHDVAHARRVYRLARQLTGTEGGDFTVVGAAALVHDLHRLGGEEFVHPRETLPEVRSVLAAASFPERKRPAVCHCVEYHEEYDFAAETDLDHEPTIEERILRDADNLDAMGAIGVARAVQFGARHGRRLYDPDDEAADTYDRAKRDKTIVQHLREKILRLPEAMETGTGRELAADRATFVESFVERIEAEHRGDC